MVKRSTGETSRISIFYGMIIVKSRPFGQLDNPHGRQVSLSSRSLEAMFTFAISLHHDLGEWEG
jgi:hypothetical protein